MPLQIASDVEVLPTPEVRLDMMATLDWARMLESLGSKTEPSVIEVAGCPVQVHADGACLEYAVLEPCTTAGQFMLQQAAVFDGLQREFGFALVGADYYDLREWEALRCSPFLSQLVDAFGCSEDYGLFGKARTVPPWVRRQPIRESGVHFHADLREEDLGIEGCVIHAKALARILPHSWEVREFRPWYRKPGVFRPKPYGIEYRSMGASMLMDRNKYELIVQLVFNYFEDYWR